jgi:hypothetical protein
MARRGDTISLPDLPGIALKRIELARGYEFGRPSGGRVTIYKKATTRMARQKAVTVSCECGSGDGSCKVTVQGSVAFCQNDVCRRCNWKITVPSGVFAAYLAEALTLRQ